MTFTFINQGYEMSSSEEGPLNHSPVLDAAVVLTVKADGRRPEQNSPVSELWKIFQSAM